MYRSVDNEYYILGNGWRHRSRRNGLTGGCNGQFFGRYVHDKRYTKCYGYVYLYGNNNGKLYSGNGNGNDNGEQLWMFESTDSEFEQQ